MSSGRKLIELHLSGVSAQHLIDSLVEELPSPQMIKQSLLRDLPKGSSVVIDEGVVYIRCENRKAVVDKLPLFELMYPELDFVHNTPK